MPAREGNKNRWKLPDNPAPDGFRRVCVSIPDDDEYELLLGGALHRLTQQIWYNRDIDKTAKTVAATWLAAFFDTLDNWSYCDDCGDTPPAEIVEIIREIYTGGDCDCDTDESEDYMALQIQTIGGTDYLVENCCGGQTRFWALTPADQDSDGNPVSPEFSGVGTSSGGGASGAWDWGNVSDDNISCYGESATDYLLGRAEQFAHAIIDFSTAGISVFSQLDEVLEVTRIINLIITGDDDIGAIEDLTKEAVSTALSAPEIVTPLASAWDYSGRITRNDLQAWIKASPWNSNDGVPVRLILGQWIANSWLYGISGDLSRLAAACESDYTIPDNPIVSDWVYTFDFTVDEQGWERARYPDFAHWAQYDLGVGWQPRTPTGGTEHIIGIQYSQESLNLVGVEITLSLGMGGNRDQFLVASGTNLTPVYLDTTATGLTVLTASFDEVFEGGIHLVAQEYDSESDGTMMDKRIVAAKLYGNGSTPSYGSAL